MSADVCLILEGTYPYISGGVSSWVHELIKAQKHLSFALVTILPNDKELEKRYTLPSNVVSLDHVFLHQLSKGTTKLSKQKQFFVSLQSTMQNLSAQPTKKSFANFLQVIAPYREKLGKEILLNSYESWELLLEEYRQEYAEESFLDFFWSHRGLASSLFASLLAPLPPARLYHGLCTGYAGLMLARAAIEEKKPTLLTEHGIYTNERRIEIAAAEWLDAGNHVDFGVGSAHHSLRNFWIERFALFSSICYACCDQIVTLFEANQQFQIQDGAETKKLSVIPNGIELSRFSELERETSPDYPTIALVGRVVPIKDVKTFLRGAALLKRALPQLRIWILGPYEEDLEYYEECQTLVSTMQELKEVAFLGKVNLTEYLPKIDVVALTSISEAQPLVLLEAAAAGVPCIATNVGDCRDLLFGREGPDRSIGPSGMICPLADPEALAKQIKTLLTDKSLYAAYSKAGRVRAKKHYSLDLQNQRYRELYEKMLMEA